MLPLFLFLSHLDGNVVSLNFPITLITADRETLEVNNQEELEEAIEAGIDACNEDDDNDYDNDDDENDDDGNNDDEGINI